MKICKRCKVRKIWDGPSICINCENKIKCTCGRWMKSGAVQCERCRLLFPKKQKELKEKRSYFDQADNLVKVYE